MAVSRRALNLAALLLLTLIWGSTWAAIRISLRSVPPLTGVALRFASAGALLLILALVRRVPLGRTRQERWLWATNALLTFAGSYGIVFWAEQWLPSGLASVLFATFPLWTVLLAPLLLPEQKLTWRGGTGVALGFVGVAVIFSHDLSPGAGGKAAFAGAVFLIAPLLSAVSNLLAKRWGSGVHPLSMTAVPMLLGALCIAPVAAVVEKPLAAGYDARGLLALAYLAVVGSAVAFSVYFWLLRRMSVVNLSMITYTAPVVAVAVGSLLFDERLGPHALLGSAIVLGGVLITVAVRHQAPEGVDGPAVES